MNKAANYSLWEEYPIERIEWEDSHEISGWHNTDDLDGPCVCISVGYVVEVNKKRVILAGSINQIGQGLGILLIPRGTIRKRERLSVVEATE